MTKRNPVIAFFIRSRWVIAFAFLCLIFYERELEKRETLHAALLLRLEQAKKQKFLALKERRDLESRIAAGSDTALIELTLIKELGLVPEDMQKVYFYPNDNNSLIVEQF